MKFLFTLLFVFTTLFASAQKKETVYFLKNDGKFVLNKDSADYVRFITEPDSGEVNYFLEEFYRNGNKKTLGNISWFKPNLVFEGTVTTFYENGKREKIQTFVRNVPTGNAYYYYPNGKIKEQRVYPPAPDKKSLQPGDLNEKGRSYDSTLYKVLQYADSTGKQFLDEKGTGKVEIRSAGKDLFVGNYLNGVKNGDWIEYVLADSVTYKETYKSGTLIKGERISANGSISHYNTMNVLPEFKGGISALGTFIYKNLSYPQVAKNRNIRGRVLIKFVINEDGDLIDAEPVIGIGGGCDEAALEVINRSPRWMPGLKRGAPAKFSFVQPIAFGVR